MIFSSTLSAALALPLLSADVERACSSQLAQEGPKDIVETAIAAGGFETLVAAVSAAGLVETLQGEGPFTVFAPTDAAFAALPEGTLERLLDPENKGQLTSILTYHVVSGRVPAEAVLKLDGAVTVNGQKVDIAVKKRGEQRSVMVDGATVIKTDIFCSNGIIHVIDAVILPAQDNLVATAAAAGQFETLLTAAKAAGLAEVLAEQGPFTIFAPTDAAFADLPAGTVESLLKPENKADLVKILKHHVVSGRVYAADILAGRPLTTLAGTQLTARATDEGAFIDGAGIASTDLDASNGVVHVIDAVLLPRS